MGRVRKESCESSIHSHTKYNAPTDSGRFSLLSFPCVGLFRRARDPRFSRDSGTGDGDR